MSAPQAAAPLLAVRDLTVTYAPPRRKGSLGTGAALSGVDLEIRAGEIVGIVGETGSGKTTLARATVGLVQPAVGSITFEGRELAGLHGRALRDFRRSGQVQLAFQDPLRSLDGDLSVAQVVGEPLDIVGGLDRTERRRRVDEALALVGLDSSYRDRHPRQLSGGQRQRVSLARAIVTRPRLLFCDEPVSALDVSNRNLVLRLLDTLRTELGLAVVIIAHDLSSLAGVADRVAVFYRGRLVEQGPIGEVLARPAHPYTALLAASAPSVQHEDRLEPDQLRHPVGDTERSWSPAACVFAPRCAFAHDACDQQPALLSVSGAGAGADESRAGADPEVGDSRRTAACHVAGTWRTHLDRRPGSSADPTQVDPAALLTPHASSRLRC